MAVSPARSLGKRLGPRGRHFLVAALLAPLATACYDFHPTGPEDAPVLSNPALVSVEVIYLQPNGCINVVNPCGGPVVFFASWMKPGGEFALSPVAGTHFWEGRALAVPVNFPPNDDPYLVRVFDPYISESTTNGITGNHLTVGGQLLNHYDRQGTPQESALVYVDSNGIGHNVF